MNAKNISETKILIVDDEPVNLYLLQEIMEVAGYENSTSVLSPVEAIDLYEKEDFDLVLLDLNMPEMSGYAVLDRFTEMAKTPKAKVVVLTGHNDEEIRNRVMRQGADGMLSKPFSITDIVDCIKKIMA